MENTLKAHEEMIDKHEYKLEDIQRDLIDIKVRLGIKDKTNGQVIDYQKQLVDAQEQERTERKDADNQLNDKIDKLDNRTWYILTGVILSILLEIAFVLMNG
ncbi:MAG: hypothetical protein J6Y78_04275 [Paludibacteraceae bacterium]|nr:hypothetical protein [Paludibacteraceae bacterium]